MLISTVKSRVFKIIFFKLLLDLQTIYSRTLGSGSHTIPLSYMLVISGRRITSIPLMVVLSDRHIRQNTYYTGQQVGNIRGQWGISLPKSSTHTALELDVLMECQFSFFFFFKEWEYQRQKLTWRHTAPGMGNLEEGRDSGSTIMIHQNTVYMSGP